MEPAQLGSRQMSPEQMVAEIKRQQKEIEYLRLAEDPGDFPPAPVNDAGLDQVKTNAGVHLLPQLAGV